ncbi:hypothetical protein N7457_003934 [Penicillium paradoxum]|uniref:uncharacterized protein n=1 Tax=Penicillium paradoxum TaxID=176176 RepID=UPI0025490576|nr:uncharacterized protein N7457_003934 [Penicillium paradoxum]KAJ5782160.1 hypothetical protein N7457_003934 [Penicillium paradoxum]
MERAGMEKIGDGGIIKNNGCRDSEDSLVVTHPTTNSPACGLSTAERTGSPIFHTLWSYDYIMSVYKTLEGANQKVRVSSARKSRYNPNLFNYILGEDSLVVTHPTTNSPACGLSTAERTGSPVFHTLWSGKVSYNIRQFWKLGKVPKARPAKHDWSHRTL